MQSYWDLTSSLVLIGFVGISFSLWLLFLNEAKAFRVELVSTSTCERQLSGLLAAGSLFVGRVDCLREIMLLAVGMFEL